MIDLAKIPASLRERNQWLLWRLEFRGAKPTKVPYRADGNYAKTNDPATWTDFVSAAAVANRFTGIGFVFAAEDPFCGIDLDGCRDPATGRVADWARAIIEGLNTYAEVSPSETGVKLWVAGQWAAFEHKVVLENVEQIGEKQAAIEVYSERRYFAMTGWRLEGPAEPQQRQEQLDALHRSHFADTATTKPRTTPSGHAGGAKAPPGDDDRATAIEALKHLPAIRYDDYAQWLEVGMVLHSIGDDMLDAWDSWSASSKKYEPGECAAKWKTFDRTGGGLKIGSLVKWAKDNGWEPRRRDGGSTAGSSPKSLPTGSTIVTVIRDHFNAKYDPTFRRGPVIWSNKLAREIGRAEACAAPNSAIIPALLGASDFPRDNHGPKAHEVPRVYRNWAPTAWADMIEQLDEESESPEVSENAGEQFRASVADLLRTLETFGHKIEDKDGNERNETQRRSLIDWCRLFAKPGTWKQIRSLSVWCKVGDNQELQVAVHQGLFSQVRRGNCPTTHRRFAELCERYSVGTRGRTSASTFVVLAKEFVAELIETPCDGRRDDDCDATSHVRARSASRAPSRAPSHAGSNGVSDSPYKTPHSEGRGE